MGADYTEFSPGHFALDVDVVTGLINLINTITKITQLTPIEKANIHNTAVLGSTNFLVADLTPTNSPTTFEIMVAMSTSGNLTAIITKAANAQTVTFNVTSGAALVAGGLYTFSMLVHAGDSVNFQYSVAGTIQVFRVQEIDASVA
jgi:hypothetical protein